MAGHVFHPGHEELHGITVVVTGDSRKLYVGRYHERVARGVLLHDAAVHDPAGEEPAPKWIGKQLKFGVRVEHRSLVVPHEEARNVVRLVDFDPSAVDPA